MFSFATLPKAGQGLDDLDVQQVTSRDLRAVNCDNFWSPAEQ